MADLIGVKRVIKIALISRIFSLLIQSVSNNLLIDYDTSVEHYPCHPNTTNHLSHKRNTIIDQLISTSLAGLTKWDAVYFLDIAQHGYQYEQNMAFFPLFPLSIYTFGLILTPIQLLINLSDRSILLLSAIFINTVAFTIAAIGLYILTQTIFHSSKLAQRVVLLFCINPASVFFSAFYSESIFAMTQFWGMLFLERNQHFRSALIFALGTTARSNGLISCGFIAYKCLQEILILFMLKSEQIRPKTVVLKSLKVTFLLCIIILPFLLFQYYGYRLFCKTPQLSPWCFHYVPIAYSYIQKHYWNVGFLKYYEIKQLPNFALASPVVVLSLVGIYEYLARQTKKDILSLGLWIVKKTNSLNIFVYVIHLVFVLALGITSIHVQVITRFILSSSPMVYWIAVSWITPSRRDDKIHSNPKQNFLYVYFLLFYCLGYLLHCNFYPWT